MTEDELNDANQWMLTIDYRVALKRGLAALTDAKQPRSESLMTIADCRAMFALPSPPKI